jgi:hypothetical protein
MLLRVCALLLAASAVVLAQTQPHSLKNITEHKIQYHIKKAVMLM